MTDTLKEQLNALVDDELEAGEESLLLRQLGRDETLRRQLARYQLVSDALKDNLPERVDPDFHVRVQAALAELPEPAPAGVPLHLERLLKPVAGLAVAASVAFVAVLSLQSTRDTATQPVPAVASAPAATDYIRAEGQSVAAAPAVRDLDAYLVNHNEFVINRGMQGMLPYVRFVGQGTQPAEQEDSE
ncbi:MAG: sigma-E factor negative regulatory protein [Gammaproteobacteria bacterium]|nr:sigma-E factor negative regulatory protein [Gammaproteobacteria bacterium]